MILGSMTSQRKPPRAFRGGLGGREWQETVLVVGIMCMGLLLLSTFLLYSISERQERGEVDTALIRFCSWPASMHTMSTCHMLRILQHFHDLASCAEALMLSSGIRLLAGQHVRQ